MFISTTDKDHGAVICRFGAAEEHQWRVEPIPRHGNIYDATGHDIYYEYGEEIEPGNAKNKKRKNRRKYKTKGMSLRTRFHQYFVRLIPMRLC